MVDARRLFSAAAIALLFDAPAKGADKTPPVRLDYLVNDIRLTGITDTSNVAQRVVRSWNLFRVRDFYFVHIVDIDSRVEERRFELLGDQAKERITFTRGERDTGLTRAQVALRFGLLRAGSMELKFSTEDAARRTVVPRIQRAFDDWRPGAREALGSVYQALLDCPVQVPRGDLLQALFATVTRGTCVGEVERLSREALDDKPFVLIAPGLKAVLQKTR